MFCTTTTTRGSLIRSRIPFLPRNKENLSHSSICMLWQWLLIIVTENMTVDATMPDKQKKRLLSLTPGSKVKLPLLVIPWPSRIRQTYLWKLHSPNHLPPNHPRSLLPRNNPIPHRWILFPSWPAMASWPVMSVRSISKTTCASIVVQKTTS